MNPLRPDEPNPGLFRTRLQLRASGVKEQAHQPLRSGIHHRGYLPHIKREGASYFVTFRLADSLPREVLLKFEAEKAVRLRRLDEARRSGKPLNGSEAEAVLDVQRKIERYLDGGPGACYLRRPEIAGIVAAALKHFQDKRYLLHEWVVMPNHVHVLVWPMPNELLGKIVGSWKQFSSRAAKKILELGDEPFWQREPYDHWIRDDQEKAHVSRYIRQNPVTAGLCSRPEDWPWSSAYRPSCNVP